jgi:hypothetical protein
VEESGMRNVVMRLLVAIGMELVLALAEAPFYMQVFPLMMFGWAVYDITRHTKIIKIQTPIDIPKDLQKQLEKHAKKQLKDIEKQLKSDGKVVKKDEEKE